MSSRALERGRRLLDQIIALTPPDPVPLRETWAALPSVRALLAQDGDQGRELRDALDEAEARLSMNVMLVQPRAPWLRPHVLQGAAPTAARVPAWKGQDPTQALRAAAAEQADRLALEWTEAVDSPGVAHPWEPRAYWSALVARVSLGVWLETPDAFDDAERRLATLREWDQQLLALGRPLERPAVGMGQQRLLSACVDRERYPVLWRTPRGFRMPGRLVLLQ